MGIGIEESPNRLGRYDVRGKIGEGGMAVVYLGRARGETDPERRLVALKVIKGAYSMNTEFLTMFADEAKIVERLTHPSIVRVYELGAEGSRLFMAMEFLNGQSLWQLWAACRDRAIRLRYDVLAYIGARVAEGLHHAHELREERGSESLNIVHRDVNPSNIFLTYDGKIKVIDFGLAWAKNKAFKTRVGIVKGKLAYLSPEQALGGTVDRRADVFALAVTLWELSTDRRLFRVEGDVETLERVIAGVVPNPLELVEGYPPALWEILRRGLAHDPNQRFSSAAELALALDAFCRTQGEPVTPSTIEDILDALFPEEKAKNAEWLEKAEHGGRPVSATLRPGASFADQVADMPEIPGPPSVPFNLPLGDFAPPSLPILPGNEHAPISSEVSSATGSNLVPFEYIAPEHGSEIDDAPRSVHLGAQQLVEQRIAASARDALASEPPAPVPSEAPGPIERSRQAGNRRMVFAALAVLAVVIAVYLKFA